MGIKLVARFIVVGALLCTQYLFAQTNTWDGSSSANWNTAANWSLNQVPTSAHDVVIPNNITVTITVNTAAVCNSLTINGGGTDQTVTISGGNSLTVTNGVIINSGTGFGDLKLLAVNAGTLNCSSITMAAGAGFNRGTQLTVSTGTVNVSGDITIGSSLFGTNDFTFTGAGTLNVGGSFTGGDFTASTSTVNYNGNNQTISSEYNYNNLTFSGSGDASADGALTIGGDFTINTVGSLELGSFTHNIAGDWINDNGTLDASGSTVNLNGAGQNIGGTNSTTFNDLTLNGSGIKTFSLSTTIAGTFSIGSGVVANLGTFTDHTANALTLQNVGQVAGTWGSSSSAATNQNDTFFSATTGIITTAVDGPTTYYSRQTGNWNATTTWSTVTYGNATNNGTFPQAGDIVNIGGATLTVTVNVNSACGKLSFLENNGNSPTLSIASGIDLDVSGTVNIPRTSIFSGDVNTLSVGAGTLTAAAIDFSGGGLFGENQLTISTGTVTITGDISTDVSLFFPTIEFTGAGLLQVGGDFLEADVGTLIPGTGTVEYNGSGNQSISNFTYNNLILSGSGNKSAAGALDIDGDFTLSAGLTFIGGSFTHTLAGDWLNNGATFTSSGSTISFDGTTQVIGGTGSTTFHSLLVDGSTTTFNYATTINATFTISNGGVADLGSILTHTTKTLAFDGGGQTPGTWGSTISIATNKNDVYFNSTSTGIITVTNTIYYARQTGNWNATTSWSTVDYGDPTNNGFYPTIGDIARIGGGFTITVTSNEQCSFVEYETGVGNTNTLTISSGNTLNITDAVNISAEDGDTNTFNVGAGTLNTVDLIFNPVFAAGAISEFTISTGTATITGDATNNGPDFLGIRQTAFIIFSGAGLLQVAGDFLDSDDGDLTQGTGTVEYNGSQQQIIADFTYYNLTLNNTSSSTPALTLFDDVTVTNTLTLTEGIVNLAGFTLTLGNGGASTLTRTTSTTTNWMYGGTMERYWPASTAITSTSGNYYGLFPVGISTVSSYRPVEFNSTVAQTGAGIISVNHTDFTGTTALSPVYDDAGTDIEVKDNSSFVITNTATGGTYNISLTMTGFGAGTVDDYRLAKNNGSTTVTTVGTHAAATGSGTNPTAHRTGVTSAQLAGDWRLTSTDITATPLPVELISFNVLLEGELARLTWVTAQEINNDYFEIEYSNNGYDFSKVGLVDGNGTTNEESEYSFTHKDLRPGLNYYRLKQVDYDGQFEYSEIKRVSLGAFEDVSVSIYPNPSVDKATIWINGGLAAQIELITLSGTILKSISYEEGMSSHVFDVTNLESGMYLIRVQGPNVNTIKRLVIR